MKEQEGVSEADLTEDLAGPPRWVKILGVIALLAMALYAVVTITRGVTGS